MRTTVRFLFSAVIGALLFYAITTWLRRVPPGPAGVPRISDVVEKLKVDLGLADGDAAEGDPGEGDPGVSEPQLEWGEEDIAKLTDAGMVETQPEWGEEGIAKVRVPGMVELQPEWGEEKTAKVRKSVRREISRRRRVAYKELRPLEQKAFRLKNESSGLRPHKPSRNANQRIQRQYKLDLEAYLDANQRIVRELRKAVAERDRAAAVYGKLKEDSLLALRCAPSELAALALTYGIIQPNPAGEK